MRWNDVTPISGVGACLYHFEANKLYKAFVEILSDRKCTSEVAAGVLGLVAVLCQAGYCVNRNSIPRFFDSLLFSWQI